MISQSYATFPTWCWMGRHQRHREQKHNEQSCSHPEQPATKDKGLEQPLWEIQASHTTSPRTSPLHIPQTKLCMLLCVGDMDLTSVQDWPLSQRKTLLFESYNICSGLVQTYTLSSYWKGRGFSLCWKEFSKCGARNKQLAGGHKAESFLWVNPTNPSLSVSTLSCGGRFDCTGWV